jgi:putative flippase GtrA
MPPTASNEPGRYQRFRQLIQEGAKFGVVGLLGIIVTNVVFIPLHNWLRLGPLTSVTIATAMATVVTFLGNRHWSFAHREGAGTGREGATFFVLNGIGLLIQYAVLGLSNYVFGLTGKLENVIAVNVGIGLGSLFRFWSYRKWVWVPPEVHLARLRRGRHRRGRTTPVPPPLPPPSPPPAGPAPGTIRLQDHLRQDDQPQRQR